ncbi:hypothetical protein SEA_CHEESETOUCH_91 [Gordonia phage CheeseTouch]
MSVPSLESLLAQHRPDLAIGTKKRVYCTCNEWGAFVETVQQADREHAAHVAEVISDSRVLQSDNLDDSWPTGTVIQEIHDCGKLCGDCFYPQLWEMAFQCGWSRVGKSYDPDDDQPAFPCRLLWVPADGAEVAP